MTYEMRLIKKFIYCMFRHCSVFLMFILFFKCIKKKKFYLFFFFFKTLCTVIGLSDSTLLPIHLKCTGIRKGIPNLGCWNYLFSLTNHIARDLSKGTFSHCIYCVPYWCLASGKKQRDQPVKSTVCPDIRCLRAVYCRPTDILTWWNRLLKMLGFIHHTLIIYKILFHWFSVY